MSLLVRLAGDEGLSSVMRRIGDRTISATRAAMRSAIAAWIDPTPSAALNVLGTELSPRLGGLQAQLIWRLDCERRVRRVSVLHPTRAGGYRLRQMGPGPAGEWAVAPGPHDPAALESDEFEEAVRRSARLTGASTLICEGGKLPMKTLARLSADFRLILSLHDFAFLCPDHEMIQDGSAGASPPAFCDVCDGRSGEDAHARWREAASSLVQSAGVLVFPSGFLRARHETLMTATSAEVEVIAPGIPFSRLEPRMQPPGRRVAIAGSIRPHKGSRRIADVVAAGRERFEWFEFGAGDRTLRDLRGLGVQAYGYYGEGRLPHLLRDRRIDVTLLLSAVPETFCLTLSESWHAGIPVVANRIGALEERIDNEGGGVLVDPDASPQDVLDALEKVLALPPRVGIPPSARESAEAFLRLLARH